MLLNLLANAREVHPRAADRSRSRAEVEQRLGRPGAAGAPTPASACAPEDIPRAFEPFTQLDSSLSRRYGGSGIGLYLARALAEAQGATLALESAPGAGTTALLRFPASRLLAAIRRLNALHGGTAPAMPLDSPLAVTDRLLRRDSTATPRNA